MVSFMSLTLSMGSSFFEQLIILNRRLKPEDIEIDQIHKKIAVDY